MRSRLEIEGAFFLLSLISQLGGTIIPPVSDPKPLALSDNVFSHDVWDDTLQSSVDESGQVDYAALLSDPALIEEYCLSLAACSPDSHPVRFQTEHSRLTYWINAYNAVVIKTVLTHYPLSSVHVARPPWWLPFAPTGSGFFSFGVSPWEDGKSVSTS